ncbi:AP-5 complex subunit beta-1 [Anabrus simplex]|uniref:AP-5 complex subunit beta-1 n=1 Tax=Anabrus simplex TaxID=316456 RepID=UPI0035A2D541
MENRTVKCLIDRLYCQGVRFESGAIQDCGTLLDQLFKILLQDKGDVTVTAKLNIAAFIESESTELFTTITDLELTFATFKNVFNSATGADSAILQGQSLISITTLLLQAVDKWPEEELELLFSDHINFLLALLKQNKNVSNVYVRSVAANCLVELELCFPCLLRPCLDLIYVSSVAETSIAHQQYMSLLALVVKHSLMKDCPPASLWGKQLQPHLESNFVAQNVEDLSFSDLNQIVSFLMDQLPLCTCEGMIWIATQLISMMMSRTELQASAQVLKPLLLNYACTYNVAAFHMLLMLEKNLGNILFQEQDRNLMLQQLCVNSNHPALPACTKLIYLDYLRDYLSQIPQKTTSLLNAAIFLPGCFDGPETQLKKLQLLSTLLKHEPGSTELLFKAVDCVQKQMRIRSSLKLRSALVRILYKYLSDQQTSEMEDKICGALLTSAVEDVTMAPFVLNFIQKVQETFRASSIPASLLTSLVVAYTKPDSPATLSTLHFVLDVFLAAVLQNYNIDYPKAILIYIMKYVMCDEVCEVLNWRLGHQILWLCYNLMKEYDTVSFFHELCDVLRAFMSKSGDVDQQDRAQLYFTLLVSLSNKKLKSLLKAPKQNISGIMSHDSTFHSSTSIQSLNKPFLRIRKMKSNNEFSNSMTTEEKELPRDVLAVYYQYVESTAAQTKLLLRVSVECAEDIDEEINTLEAVAVFFNVPESWGEIKPVMIGHLDRKKMATNSHKLTEAYVFDVACLPIKPYPVSTDVRTEFSIEGTCHTCALDRMDIEFADFFHPLPVPEEFTQCASQWRTRLHQEMWQSFEAGCAAFNSIHVLHCEAEQARTYLLEKLASFLVHSDKDGTAYLSGIYLPPAYHLLMKFQIQKEKTVINIITDDLNVLAFTIAFLQTWS